jgi:rod shape-determining protein MreD
MKKYLFFLIIVFAAMLQVTLLDSFRILNVKPDLFLISIVIASIIFDFKWAIAVSIFAGILKDAFGADVFGINTLLFPLWSFSILKLSKKISLENNIICTGAVFIIVLLNDIIIRMIFISIGKTPVSLGSFLGITFLEAIYTVAILPLAFKGIRATLHL